jgi:hypothetical protein
MNFVSDFLDWLATLPADFAFLLLLPFVVGAVGLLADRPKRRAAQPLPATPPPIAARPRDAMKPG